MSTKEKPTHIPDDFLKEQALIEKIAAQQDLEKFKRDLVAKQKKLLPTP